MNSNRSHKDPS
jgi:hypothetical protein